LERDDVKDDIIYKAALTFKHEELAGMYAILNKREYDLQKALKVKEERYNKTITDLLEEIKIKNQRIDELEKICSNMNRTKELFGASDE